ncbi:MAG: type I-E CRISPR-associated protein Cse1/CasA, partial [Chloroflexi bacterium]|nr:type I-E CRISPR-associated protein Cse1/CasA [Chloroflexota bacterium]
MTQSEPSFNLWTEPWITLERSDGSLAQVGIEETLLRAGEFRTIYDTSPLVIVGIHRLLTAVLQDALDPQRPDDLRRLWVEGYFPEAEVRAFGERYAHRFDLFSVDAPFLQSADLPRTPPKRAKTKTVVYLASEMPDGSDVTHYQHGVAEENVFCPTCAARGLVTIPAFATSGGRGFFPSINGAPPPIYVLPGGNNLFESLAASLILPDYQPSAASNTVDRVWWRHEPRIVREQIVHEVSYLHSLTFPARRVRLHPQRTNKFCSRCGTKSEWVIQTMIYFGGEHLPKDGPAWFDPFVAYRYVKGNPRPITLQRGKALWREFAGLFLQPSEAEQKEKKRSFTKPPSCIYQIAEEVGTSFEIYPFRCIALSARKDAKVFEWLDAGFDVPVSLLHDFEGSDEVRQAIDFATYCAGIISTIFRKAFLSEDGRTEHHETLRRRMMDAYWAALAAPFRDFVLVVAEPETREATRLAWVDRVVTEGKAAFKTYSEMTGSDAMSLRKRVTGRRICDIRLNT